MTTQDCTPAHVRKRSWFRAQRLRKLGYKDYSAYLGSPKWKAIKANYRASDLPQACMCGEEEEVQLHHTTYERVGEELLTDLAPLCKRCHEMVHALERRGELGLNMSGLESLDRAYAYAAVQRARRQQARTEFLSRGDRYSRNLLSLTARLRDAVFLANRDGLDVRGDLRVIDKRVQAIEAKLDARREANAPVT